MHRHHHYLVAMVVVAFGLSLGAASLVGTMSTSSAAQRIGITIKAMPSPTDNVLLPLQTDLIVERFVLRSGREDVLVDTLSLQNCITTTSHDNDADCADTGESAGNDATITAIALLYNDGDNDRRTRGTLVDGRATFPNLDLMLPAGEEIPVAVRITTASIDGSVVPSGAQFQLNLNAATAPFHGTAKKSGAEITEADVKEYTVGHARTLRQTLAELALASTAPSGAAEDGWSEVFRMNTSAAATGDVTIEELTFALSVTNTGGGNWHTCPFLGAYQNNFGLVDIATGATVPVTWTTYDVDGTACTDSDNGVGYIHATFTTPVRVPAGAATTYAFFLDTTYAADNDFLRITIPSENELADVTSAISAVVWSDGVTTAINGEEIDDLPVLGNVLIF